MVRPRQIDTSAKKIPLKLSTGEEIRIAKFRQKVLLEVDGNPEIQQRLVVMMREGTSQEVI